MITGEFAVTSAELQSVIKILRGAGINIVAIHNHMTSGEPTVYFLHYWGKGKAADLAMAVKKALNTQRLAG